MKEENVVLEQKLLEAIGTGTNTFTALCVAVGVDPSMNGQSNEFRKVDQRLQSMRKRGLIRFHRALGWKAVKS